MMREFTMRRRSSFFYSRPQGSDGWDSRPAREGNVMVFLEFGVCRVTITLAGTSDVQSGVDVVKGKETIKIGHGSQTKVIFPCFFGDFDAARDWLFPSSLLPLFGPEVVTEEFYQFVSELAAQTERKTPKPIGSHLAQNKYLLLRSL